MRRPRIAAAAALFLVVAGLSAAAAGGPQQQPTTGAQPVVAYADFSMRAQADHGVGDQDSGSLLEDGFLHEPFRSNYSGNQGTESAKARQDTDLTLDPDKVSPRLLRVETSSEFTSSATAKPPQGGVDGYAEGSLSIAVQSDNFLTLVVEGTLITGHSSGAGCAHVQLHVSSLGLDETTQANTGPDCGENYPKQTAVVEEFQLAPGGTSIDLAADTFGEASCVDGDCDPAATGLARWDFTFSFCSNSFSDGSDLIIGTAEPELLCGGLGADEISGGDGNDVILGDAGNDILSGGQGADILAGEGGSDEIWGDAPDHCTSFDEGDDLDPGPGDDEMHGCGGDDWFYAGSSLGVLAYGGPGSDTMVGGSGPDHFWGGGARDQIGGFGGNDKLYGEGGNDDLYGHAGGDRLEGGAGTRDLCRGGGQATDRRFSCER